MKRYRGWIIFVILTVICAGGVWLTLRITAEYPALGTPVSYPVNQFEGFELSIGKPVWSPLVGYTIKWEVSADSEEVYYFIKDTDSPGFEFLERFVDGQWYRLGYSQDIFSFSTIEFALGGEESSGLEGSITQKYAYYGTRLEPGAYRVALEMRGEDGSPHYLAAEFDVE